MDGFRDGSSNEMVKSNDRGVDAFSGGLTWMVMSVDCPALTVFIPNEGVAQPQEVTIWSTLMSKDWGLSNWNWNGTRTPGSTAEEASIRFFTS